MSFPRWLGTAISGKDSTPDRGYRPTLDTLEDRTVPSTFSRIAAAFRPAPPLPATHLEVSVPANVQAGKPFHVKVDAETATNRLATGYTGTVHLSLLTADSGATIPLDYK